MPWVTFAMATTMILGHNDELNNFSTFWRVLDARARLWRGSRARRFFSCSRCLAQRIEGKLSNKPSREGWYYAIQLQRHLFATVLSSTMTTKIDYRY